MPVGPHGSQKKQVTARNPLTLFFSGLAFIPLVLQDSPHDWQGNQMLQHHTFCALLPGSPPCRAEAACLGHEYQHGSDAFKVKNKKMEEINR